MSILSTISRRCRVLRGPRRTVKRCSVQQKVRRDAFRAAVTAKTKAWSLGYRPLWSIYADFHPIITRRKQLIRATADNWFLKINIIRFANGLEPILKPG